MLSNRVFFSELSGRLAAPAVPGRVHRIQVVLSPSGDAIEALFPVSKDVFNGDSVGFGAIRWKSSAVSLESVVEYTELARGLLGHRVLVVVLQRVEGGCRRWPD